MNDSFEVFLTLIPTFVLIAFAIIGIDLYLLLRTYLKLKINFYKDKNDSPKL